MNTFYVPWKIWPCSVKNILSTSIGSDTVSYRVASYTFPGNTSVALSQKSFGLSKHSNFFWISYIWKQHSYNWWIFIGWLGVCLTSAWPQNLQNKHQSAKMANFYRLVRVPAWSWNLEFCTKIGIQKSRCHFLRVWRHKNVSQSFWRIFSHFLTVFRTFDTCFAKFVTRLKSTKFLTTR